MKVKLLKKSRRRGQDMERPNKKDYDFNDVFENIRFASNMIKYVDYIEAKQVHIYVVSKCKVDEREQAYQMFFRDNPQIRGNSYRLRDNHIFHKDEAYECIDHYLRTGIKP